MEEIEIISWLTLDAVKTSKTTEIIETIGNLQTGHYMSVFCIIEEDYLELCYSDSAANYLRRYEDKGEFDAALENRKEEAGEARYEEVNDLDLDEDFEENEGKDKGEEGELEVEDDSERY